MHLGWKSTSSPFRSGAATVECVLCRSIPCNLVIIASSSILVRENRI